VVRVFEDDDVIRSTGASLGSDVATIETSSSSPTSRPFGTRRPPAWSVGPSAAVSDAVRLAEYKRPNWR